ncbi:MAG: ACT domain-containing protein, partial [bacterium]
MDDLPLADHTQLYRAIGLIRRRDYNVSSLVVGATDESGTSRMVLVIEAANVQQVVSQLSRLIDVLSVAEVEHDSAQLDRFADAMRNLNFTTLAPTTTQEISR